MNMMTMTSVIIKLMIIIIVIISIIDCQYTNTVLIKILSASMSINTRKEIINSKIFIRKTMKYMEKAELKKSKFNKSDKMFKTFARYIVSVKIFINNLITNYYDFYILNLEAIHHCSNNKALFKNL